MANIICRICETPTVSEDQQLCDVCGASLSEFRPPQAEAERKEQEAAKTPSTGTGTGSGAGAGGRPPAEPPPPEPPPPENKKRNRLLALVVLLAIGAVAAAAAGLAQAPGAARRGGRRFRRQRFGLSGDGRRLLRCFRPAPRLRAPFLGFRNCRPTRPVRRRRSL